MAKLYFKYGTMGSSKSAQALTTKFNYESLGSNVWFIKPATDTRDGSDIVKSRIGLSAKVEVFNKTDNLYDAFNGIKDKFSVVIADEAQFFTKEQIDRLHDIAADGTPVLCYGLRTDFRSNFFEGSRRLMEVAESIGEIKMVCRCGKKATINARMNKDGEVVSAGRQVVLGGDDMYEAMCYNCWRKKLKGQDEKK